MDSNHSWHIYLPAGWYRLLWGAPGEPELPKEIREAADRAMKEAIAVSKIVAKKNAMNEMLDDTLKSLRPPKHE